MTFASCCMYSVALFMHGVCSHFGSHPLSLCVYNGIHCCAGAGAGVWVSYLSDPPPAQPTVAQASAETAGRTRPCCQSRSVAHFVISCWATSKPLVAKCNTDNFHPDIQCMRVQCTHIALPHYWLQWYPVLMASLLWMCQVCLCALKILLPLLTMLLALTIDLSL